MARPAARVAKEAFIDTIIGGMASFAIAVISAGGYLGIVLLMALESACTPLPSELIMPFAGYLVTTGRFNLWLVATAGAIGCNVGSTVAYYAGWYGGRPLVQRYGRYVLMSEAELDRVERFFVKHGGKAVLIGRLLPLIRTFIALPAGIARMPMLPFQIYTFIGSWPWCFALAYVGMRLGQAWNNDPTLKAVMHRFDYVAVVLLAAGIVWYVRHLWRGRQATP